MKIALLLLLLMPCLSISTPSLAQRCTRDVIASVSNSDDGTIITMVSGAVFRELPMKSDEYAGWPPWLASGHDMLICGDHALLSVDDACPRGSADNSYYYLFAVECLRCLR